MFDPARLVFIDETCYEHSDGSAARPSLGVASGSLTTRRMDIGRQSPSWPAYAIARMTAPFVLEGAMNGAMFLAYV